VTSRELDCLIIGFSVGALAFLWIGYRLRVRVERWNARRAAKRTKTPRHTYLVGELRGADVEQRLHRVLTEKPRIVPLKRRDPNTERTRDRHVDMQRIPIVYAPRALDVADHVLEATDEVRMNAYSALVEAGFKKVDARDAVEACTPEERAGGLESWVAAALRRAAAKP